MIVVDYEIARIVIVAVIIAAIVLFYLWLQR